MVERRVFRVQPGEYSPDVELDHNGVVVATRDIGRHEVICIPAHLFGRLEPKRFKPDE